MISIDDFKKIDIRVARVKQAERVVGSEKLIALTLDLGEFGDRQVVAGIGTTYEPEVLIGKTIVVLANLESRMLLGVESQGMILAAGGETPMLLTVDGDVIPGTQVR